MNTKVCLGLLCLQLVGCGGVTYARANDPSSGGSTSSGGGSQGSTTPAATHEGPPAFYLVGSGDMAYANKSTYIIAVTDGNVNCGLPGAAAPVGGGISLVELTSKTKAGAYVATLPGTYELGSTIDAQDANITTNAVGYRLIFDEYCVATWQPATQAALVITDANMTVGSLVLSAGQNTWTQYFEAAPLGDLVNLGNGWWPAAAAAQPGSRATPAAIAGAVGRVAPSAVAGVSTIATTITLSDPQLQCASGATTHGGAQFSATLELQEAVTQPGNYDLPSPTYTVYDNACRATESAAAAGGVLSIESVTATTITGTLYLEFGTTKLSMPFTAPAP